MSYPIPHSGLQLRSLITRAGQLELSLVDEPVREPGPDEVLIRVDAAPINPSDLGLLLGPADLSTIKVTGTAERPVVTAAIPEATMRGLTARLDRLLPVGIEGAGLVVAAGSSPAAQALLNRRVAAMGNAMYSQYRCVPVEQCMVLTDDTSAVDGASAFVNPLTALGMLETMRSEGHSALVHTAAASNLGQMLNRLCQADGVKLVNIVRKPEQAKLLREQGATYVCDSSAPSFMSDLTEALAATGATIAFDAVGGGKLSGQILGCMEAAISSTATEYSRYGSSTLKQVYLYGMLDSSPTQFSRTFGMAWSMGGWLIMSFMSKVGPVVMQRLKDRVCRELKTTFASHYSRHVSLAEVLQANVIAQYAVRATGEKFLILPNEV
ncbi:zinc-binding dehydrogenase [Paraburkholderia lacunae]|uniref:NADH oxidase n=1 Tax=Paraburkholderia lacunae TaxID=2211104 RepID=A0A370MWP9_9BURK|nr:zinc-binding dehydrogenase [Paraburkholderia lacunae]RDJ97785.1 NADH oxidase [Paraburkholderia lacunae]